MSTDIRNDAPGALRTEAMGITLKFDRTGPSTGRISWNIPQPAVGCSSDTQAYCGIVLTIDTTSNNTSKLPTNGTVYSSDPTADKNLFAGDTIGSSMVVGAFYRDRTTTFFDVSGLSQHASYFVSGFPVDCENRYYREGVHAYSLDYKQDGTQPTSGTQVVVLNPSTPPGGVLPTDATGLSIGTDYSFNIKQGLVPAPNRPLHAQECAPSPFVYTIQVAGGNAQTYQELLDAINVQLQLIDNPPQGANPPASGSLYYKTSSKQLFQWDGYNHVELDVIVQATAPNILVVGTFWLSASGLNRWDGAVWQPVSIIEYGSDPTQPQCETTYWFDGTYGYVWTGNAWKKLSTTIQLTDPSLYAPAPCGSFWYNPTLYQLKAWNDTLELWVNTTAVQYSEPPTALSVGTYWFSDVTQTMSVWSAGWTAVATRITEIEPTVGVIAGTLWYNPSSSILKVRNATNTAWTVTDLIVFDTDPTIVGFCSNWWNTTTDEMYVWDGITLTWVLVTNFFQQSNDPTDPPMFAEGAVWYNPSTSALSVWQNACFKPVAFVDFPTDPRTTIPVGHVWHDTAADLWYEMTATGWQLIEPVDSAQDPSILALGAMWMNSSTNSLSSWNGISWVSVTYSTQPLTPSKGAKWFNTATNTLMVWNGEMWVVQLPKITVDFNCNGNFIFTDTSVGSLSWVSIENVDLFSSLTTGFRINNPEPGTDGVSAETLYNEVGIGTDGTNDERLQLGNEIRFALGYPTVEVELAPEQINFAIDSALQTYREHCSHAYSRGYFFLQINSEEQRYLLTNKVSGMNKIVQVMGVHRLTSAFLSSAHGAGVYGQIVLQHLYNMGTFDLLSYHLMSEYTKTMEILFANRVTFNWNEQTRELWLHQRFPFSERLCLVDAAVERTEQQLLSDRVSRPWLRRWATAEAMLMLANSRGKYASLPGAGGGVSLNASDLRTQATTDKDICMAEIQDFVVDTPETWGLNSTFIFG